MLKPSSCDYSDPYILVNGNIKVTRQSNDATVKRADETNKDMIFKNYAPFRESITEINHTQTENAKDIDVVMAMYNLIEHSNNY